jgi:hypothetical protein
MVAVPRVLTKEQAGIACDRVGIDKRTEEVLNGRPNGLPRSCTNRGSTDEQSKQCAKEKSKKSSTFLGYM